MNKLLAWMDRRGLITAAIVACSLRIVWAVCVQMVPQSDSAMYEIFAQRIAQGLGYSYPDGGVTVYWAVGPAALYGGLYALMGQSYSVASAANVGMGVGLVWLTGALAQQQFGRRIGWLAALALAFWPLWIEFTTIISSELPFAFLLVASLAVRRGIEEPWRATILSTVFLVGATYMRPIALPLIIGLPLLDIFAGQKLSRVFGSAALAFAVAGVLMTPWALRNHAHFGVPVLVSANFGANLWMGNNPKSDGGYMPLPDEKWSDELVREADLEHRAISFIEANPLIYARLCVGRLQKSFDRESIGVVWNGKGISDRFEQPLKFLSLGWWLVMFALSLIGAALFVFAAPSRLFHPLIVAPGLIMAVALLVVGQDRYHVPADPFVAVFAAYAVSRISRRFAAKRGRNYSTASPRPPHDSVIGCKRSVESTDTRLSWDGAPTG